MQGQEPEKNRTMSASIRQLILRLSPVLVTINRADLFTFGSTTIKSSKGPSTITKTATTTATATIAATTLLSSSSSTPSDSASSQPGPSSPSPSSNSQQPSVILRPWSTLLHVSNLQPLSSPAVTSTLFGNKRVIFFGEQHHQPSVLKAQLSCLDLLHRHVTERGGKVVVVMEMFSLGMDGEIRKWMASSENSVSTRGGSDSETTKNTGGVADMTATISNPTSSSTSAPPPPPAVKEPYTDADLISYYDSSSEGFDLPHYMPLLYLSRALSIPVHGGFPPREWARVVHREGIDALRTHETYGPSIPKSFDEEERWRDVENIEEGYLAYIRSLTRGGAPVMPPDEDDGTLVVEEEEDRTIGRGRTEKRRRFTKGLPPAQTLKDTFFAWAIDRQLAAGPNVVVFAVCGSGHCEFGFGAVDRVRGCERGEVAVVVSKAWGSEEFRSWDVVSGDGEIVGGEGGQGGETKRRNGEGDYGNRRIADCVVPYEMYFESDDEEGNGGNAA